MKWWNDLWLVYSFILYVFKIHFNYNIRMKVLLILLLTLLYQKYRISYHLK